MNLISYAHNKWCVVGFILYTQDIGSIFCAQKMKNNLHKYFFFMCTQIYPQTDVIVSIFRGLWGLRTEHVNVFFEVFREHFLCFQACFHLQWCHGVLQWCHSVLQWCHSVLRYTMTSLQQFVTSWKTMKTMWLDIVYHKMKWEIFVWKLQRNNFDVFVGIAL